jgi:hypothetical protein
MLCYARLSASRTDRALLPETFLFLWYPFLLEGLLRLEGLGKLIKSIHLNASRTRDLPVCSVMHRSLRYRVTPEICSF